MDPRPRALAAAWVIACLAFGLALGAGTARWAELFADFDVTPPPLTRRVLEVGAALRRPGGLAVLALVAALGLRPLRFDPDAALARRWFRLTLAQVTLAAVTSWVALRLPLHATERVLCGYHHHRYDSPEARTLHLAAHTLVLGSLAVGLAQAGVWLRIVLRADPPRPASRLVDATRVTLLALPPAVVGALAAAVAVDTLRLEVPGLLVPAPLAAAGTVAASVLGLAVTARPAFPPAGPAP